MNDEQEIWYGFCTYWTDDWEALAHHTVPEGAAISSGIPCCPECKSPGFQMTLQDWNEGIKKYEADDNPGYGAFINEMKSMCSGPKVTLAELWEQKKGMLAEEAASQEEEE
jgi:hypothetical protein